MSVREIAGLRSRGPTIWIAICCVAVGLLGAGLVVGPAAAGDAVVQFTFDESERAADPGETVTVDVRASSDGGYADEGVESYSFVVAAPPEIGEPTAVEAGPWLAQGDGEIEQNVTDAGDGAIRVEHERVGADDGVTGDDVAVTVTIKLREDAPAADAAVVVADTDAYLRGGEFRMQTFGDDATIAVGGGGERLEPTYEPGTAGDGSVGVVTAEEANRSVEESDGDGGDREDGDGGGGDSDDGPMPGFGFGTAGLAVVAVLAAIIVATRSRRGAR